MELQIQPTILDTVALTLLKREQLLLGALAGGFAYYSLHKSIEVSGMAKSNASWNVMSTMLATGVGVMVYNESLTQKEMLGIGLGAISLYLMNGI